MTAGTDATSSTPRAALDAARGVFAATGTATSTSLWLAAQRVLQLVIGRPELSGQALVSETRRLGRITLSDAHALVALCTWADRVDAPPTNEAERLIVREAWMALDHAVPETPAPAAPSPFAPPAGTPVGSPLGTPAGAAPPRPSVGQQWAPPPPPASPTFAGAADTAPLDERDAIDTPRASSHRRRLLLGLGLTLLLLVVGGGAWWWWWQGRADRALAEGVNAFQRGSRESARLAFARAAQLDPQNAVPLVYLGRISREDGDLARARRLLTNAVRVAPRSSLAARELASLMLADGQPEIARRFYVRAIEIDPTDRTAQGFLGCALFRLQRFEEARRWVERAGPGEWQNCAPPFPALPLGAPAGSPLPPSRPPA